MTREEINIEALKQIDNNKYLILELITGMGKSKLAIDLCNHICKNDNTKSVLLLVAKTVHKQNWLDEITKWGGLKTSNLTIECYESLKKYTNTSFDIIIADEMQHLSEKRLEILQTIKIKDNFIGLSATIPTKIKDYFKYGHKAHFIKCGLKEAVNSDVLPEPKVYLLPLNLNNSCNNYIVEKFNKSIVTTQKGYYDTISAVIEWYKKKYMTTRNERFKTIWLSKAGNRLKWCSTQKESLILSLLEQFKSYKTLTFCASIEQSERLGKYNITSKNKDSINNLNKFNQNKIKHITACNMLNEGVNLTNCRIGIFCNINSSEIIVKQRIGRILRHKKPIVIIPYFKNTREEELVQKMIEEYSKSSIKYITDIKDIKL